MSCMYFSPLMLLCLKISSLRKVSCQIILSTTNTFALYRQAASFACRKVGLLGKIRENNPKPGVGLCTEENLKYADFTCFTSNAVRSLFMAKTEIQFILILNSILYMFVMNE